MRGNVVTLIGESREPRLTPEEAEIFFRFVYQVHDHDARRPAQPIFWDRSDNYDLSKIWN